jgi:hypothetical protein
LDLRDKISKIPSGGRWERKKRGMDEVGAKSKWGRGSPSFEGHAKVPRPPNLQKRYLGSNLSPKEKKKKNKGCAVTRQSLV